ncbi:FAD:protein FMN transferase [Microbacterium sp. RU33B]|uniref:FAD:protein FMN transferase n=1 Tax=Microbacterium sp. RU33B TaxID=1907390 RepID=UPI0009625EEE|nr:FAD:protein FMN transferase [Microbacterium sp. RU33B]SIT78683.1 thiamine biosynthesis lipoprotein [Microbacterium sp. RU33B]
MSAAARRPESRRVRTATTMGTVVSIHVVGDTDELTFDRAAESCFDELRHVERIFSTYRSDSDITRMNRGEIGIDDADPSVREVADACERAESESRGLFSAHWAGGFDPTGYVKGWAVERAARRYLEPLCGRAGVRAAGIGAGGDLQLFTADAAEGTWRVGIADPRDRTRLVATVPVRNGAVATSGSAERGAHVIDPRTGSPARGVASMTVIADRLADADLWATVGLVAGFDDLSWTSRAPSHTGISVADDGRVRRWIDATEVSVSVRQQRPERPFGDFVEMEASCASP